jgi:hypothetical protein
MLRVRAKFFLEKSRRAQKHITIISNSTASCMDAQQNLTKKMLPQDLQKNSTST